MKDINWESIKVKVREAIFVLPHFFRNPIEVMRNLPDWEWPEILILQALFAAATSVIANIIARDIFGVIFGIVIAPITLLLISVIASGFFFYVFKFAFDRNLDFRKIYVHILFASIPTMIVSTVAAIIPPIMLVGALASALLLFTGFVSNFQIPQKKLRNLLLGMLAIYALYWCFLLFNGTAKHKSLRQKATPESLDILERELKSE